jgi:uncharacterized membrane protein
LTQEVTEQIVIDLPREQAWEKLRDLSLAHNYVPGIVKTELVTEQREGVGASRYVYRNQRSWIQETVEEWQQGGGFTIRLHRGEKRAPPFQDAWFRYRLEDAGKDRTKFTATLTYRLPWGALGRWLEPRLSGVVRSTVRDVVRSMKLFYETGEPTTPAALKAFKKRLEA